MSILGTLVAVLWCVDFLLELSAILMQCVRRDPSRSRPRVADEAVKEKAAEVEECKAAHRAVSRELTLNSHYPHPHC